MDRRPPKRLLGGNAWKNLVDCPDNLKWARGIQEVLGSIGGFPSLDVGAAIAYAHMLGSASIAAKLGWVLSAAPDLWRMIAPIVRPPSDFEPQTTEGANPRGVSETEAIRLVQGRSAATAAGVRRLLIVKDRAAGHLPIKLRRKSRSLSRIRQLDAKLSFEVVPGDRTLLTQLPKSIKGIRDIKTILNEIKESCRLN